jgi:hypothetical protein
MCFESKAHDQSWINHQSTPPWEMMIQKNMFCESMRKRFSYLAKKGYLAL